MGRGRSASRLPRHRAIGTSQREESSAAPRRLKHFVRAIAPVDRSGDQDVAGAASGACRDVTGSSRIASARPAATKPKNAAVTNAIS